MKKVYYYEMFFNKANVSKDEWAIYIENLKKFIGLFLKWKLIIKVENNQVRYFLKTKVLVPISLNNNLLLQECEGFVKLKGVRKGYYFNRVDSNVMDIINSFWKKGKYVKEIWIKFRNLGKWNFDIIDVGYEYKGVIFKKRLFFSLPASFLTVDFKSNKSFVYKGVPKYLKIDKILPLLTNNKNGALFKVDTFPYLDSNFYLRHDSYDFYKHSLVIGSSGSGKSKFLALLINNIYKYSKDRYRVVVIDPHDALKDDLRNIKNIVMDFKVRDRSVDLFKNSLDDVNVAVELTMTLFKNLISDAYNSKLERVLRFSIYLLFKKNDFTFRNLRRLLLELEYRNEILNELKMEIPPNVTYFFLTDFTELKMQSYNEAIAPIIAFIDELEMVPVFSEDKLEGNIKDIINNNFLSIFSLNRMVLGDKVTKTIGGFIMQQIFLMMQEQMMDKHLIVIIDEVAILENDILARVLAEARKFNTSLILSGQYFKQISSNLQEAILANMNNYYLFRVSIMDAITLESNLKIKLANDDSKDNRYDLLTGLKNRECLVRIMHNGTLYPVFKAKTMDYVVPKLNSEEKMVVKNEEQKLKSVSFDFKIDDVNWEDYEKRF